MSELRLPTGSVSNREVSNTDGNQITEDKLWHLTKYCERFGKDSSQAPATLTVVLFKADKAGTISSAKFMCVADGSSGGTTVDIQKNGVTMLNATQLPVTSSTGNGTFVTGVFVDDTYTTDDIITAVMSEASHTGATGPVLMYDRLEQGN